VKKVEYSHLSGGGASEMPGTDAAMLARRGSTLTRSRGSQSSPRKGSDPIMGISWDEGRSHRFTVI
jgi:hypothetical protein